MNGLNHSTLLDKISNENDIPIETLNTYSLESECVSKIIDKKLIS